MRDAAKVFATEGFDVEIVEKHHNQKLDAPSGTALALADSINEAMGNPYEYVYDRSQRRQKRDKKRTWHFRSAWWYDCRRPRCDFLPVKMK